MVAEPITQKRKQAPKHKWTPEEIAYLKQWYGVAPTKRIAAHFGVNVLAVYHAREKYLGPPAKPRAKKRAWTEAEDDCLRREYRQTKASARLIGLKLGRTEAAVRRRCGQLGLAGRSTDYKRKPWTPEDDALVRQWMDAGKTYDQIGKRLGRTMQAVRIHANRYLRLTSRERVGWHTKREACEILGVDHKWLQRRIDSGALKAAYHRDGKQPQKNGLAEWHITDAALREFIRRYPEELNGRNVDLVMVVELLAGVIEPYNGGDSE